MKLWLDDLRPPPEGEWTWAKTADEAIEHLKTGEVTYASLDHDLADAATLHLIAEKDGSLYYENRGWQPGDPCPFCYAEETAKFNGGNIFFTCCDKTIDEYERHRTCNEKTGYTVTLWMAEHEVWPSDGMMVHSWNAPGGEAMCKTIDRYGPYDKKCRHIPDPRPMIVEDE